MVRLLILIIIGAAALSLAYFFFRSIPFSKKMPVVGGGFAAALIGAFLQMGYPIYMPLLALVGVSLLASLVYMKLLEKEQMEKQRLVEERKMRNHMSSPTPAYSESKPIHENTINKSFGMQSISLGEEDHKLG